MLDLPKLTAISPEIEQKPGANMIGFPVIVLGTLKA